MKIWHSKEQNRLFSWIAKQSDDRWLLYSTHRKSGFIKHFAFVNNGTDNFFGEANVYEFTTAGTNIVFLFVEK